VNEPSRLRGIARSTSPAWVATVFALVELREFACAEAALAFGDQARLEGAVAVPRHRQSQRPDLALHRLGGMAVSAVRRPAASRIALLVTQMPSQLSGQPTLEHSLDHLGQEPARAGQGDAALVGAVDQLIKPRVVSDELTQLVAAEPRRPRRPRAPAVSHVTTRTGRVGRVMVSRHAHDAVLLVRGHRPQVNGTAALTQTI